jgi:hypothetical protein
MTNVERSQPELNKIWDNIQAGNYRKSVEAWSKELPGMVIVAPDALPLAEDKDTMSIPVNGGTSRDYYQRKKSNGIWNRHAF